SVKTIAANVTTVVEIYEKAKSALDVAKAILTALGLLEQQKPIEKTLFEIQQQITSVANAVTWYISAEERDRRIQDAWADLSTVQQSLKLPPFTPNAAAVARSAELAREAEAPTAF